MIGAGASSAFIATRSALGFDAEELALLAQLAPLLGRGLRQSIALFPTEPDPGPTEGPGIIVLGTDLVVISINRQAETWLADIADADWPSHLPLPFPVMAVAAQVVGAGARGAGPSHPAPAGAAGAGSPCMPRPSTDRADDRSPSSSTPPMPTW